VAGNDRIVLIDENGTCEAKFSDAVGNLANLGFGVRAGVAGMWNKGTDWPVGDCDLGWTFDIHNCLLSLSFQRHAENSTLRRNRTQVDPRANWLARA
jgi:hypothetical protein